MNNNQKRGFVGFDLNTQGTEPWAWAIGKMMISFGAVEALSYYWIDKFANDEILHEIALSMPFAKRVNVIKILIKREDFPEKVKKQAIIDWNRALKLAEFRNEIAHNPLVFGWHGPEEKRTPDFVGVLSLN